MVNPTATTCTAYRRTDMLAVVVVLRGLAFGFT